MGFSQRQAAVDFVEGFHPFLADGIGRANRLAATANAAAGTRHDFDEIVGAQSLFDLFHDAAGILERMRYADADFTAFQVDGALFDPGETAYFGKFQFLQCFAGDLFVYGTQGCFHNTAGGTEDCTGTGTESKRIVKCTFWQILEGQANVLDELDELAGGKDNVDILSAVAAHFRPGGLKFLSRAGHDGDRDDIVHVDAGIFRIIGFGNSAEHAHRGFCRGKMADTVGEVFLHVVDPARTAGGHHGQGAAILQAIQEFGALLHDGEIGTKIRIKDLVEAQELQSRYHLSCDDGTRLHTEGIAEGYAHRGGNLDDNVFFRVLQSIEYFIRIVFFDNRTGRTDEAALTAENAIRGFHRFVEGGRDGNVTAASGIRQCGNALDVFAGTDAAPAADAFGWVADDGGIGFDPWFILEYAGQWRMLDVEAAAETLQVAVLVAGTTQAVFVVIGQHELQDGYLGVPDNLGIRMDFHALPDFRGAGSQQAAFADDFHGAKTAVGFDALILMIAEVRNIDAERLRGLHDFGPLWHFDGDIVDGQMDHGNFFYFIFCGHYSVPPTSNTSGNVSMADCRVFCAVSPRPQREDMLITRAMVDMMRMSSWVAVWLAILSRIIWM